MLLCSLVVTVVVVDRDTVERLRGVNMCSIVTCEGGQTLSHSDTLRLCHHRSCSTLTVSLFCQMIDVWNFNIKRTKRILSLSKFFHNRLLKPRIHPPGNCTYFRAGAGADNRPAVVMYRVAPCVQCRGWFQLWHSSTPVIVQYVSHQLASVGGNDKNDILHVTTWEAALQQN